ncbi:MAG TPA: SRPBCC family protein [Frankiaceae bacterium]|nr:SRPBCC family protein [Frankiaceae bacterium]
MDAQTQTRSIESRVEPKAVMALLADARRLPEWAPGFADTVEGDERQGWTVTKDADAFEIRVVVQRDACTVDYLRDIAPGLTGGAYLRVTPLIGGGSSVVITVPVIGDPAAVAATLDEELVALTRLARAS